MEARRDVQKGSTVHVTTDPEKVHVFDTSTGERLSA
jgi:multiple sugar transport system ATP-binding protein